VVAPPRGHEAPGGWNILYRRVFTMSRPPESLLILGPMRYYDARSPPDEQIITKRKMLRSMPTIAGRCRRDGCLLRYHRAERERERERGRTRETLPPSTRECAQSPILEIMSVVFRFIAKPGISRTKPSGQETQIDRGRRAAAACVDRGRCIANVLVVVVSGRKLPRRSLCPLHISRSRTRRSWVVRCRCPSRSAGGGRVANSALGGSFSMSWPRRRTGSTKNERRVEETNDADGRRAWVDVDIDVSPMGPYDRVVRCGGCKAGLRLVA